MARFVRVASVSDLGPGECASLEVEGTRLALYNAAGSWYATDDSCGHRGGPMGQGTLAGTIATCPWHGWDYDITTGVCRFDSAVRLRTYEVRVEGDDVLVGL